MTVRIVQDRLTRCSELGCLCISHIQCFDKEIYTRAYRITVITPPLQGGDAGAIPTTRFDRLVIPRSHRLQASYHHIGWSLLEDTDRRFSGWRNRYRLSVSLSQVRSSTGRAVASKAKGWWFKSSLHILTSAEMSTGPHQVRLMLDNPNSGMARGTFRQLHRYSVASGDPLESSCREWVGRFP